MPVTDSDLKFTHRAYRRPLQRPLVTARMHWNVREGILVRLQDARGRTGFGEIAPLAEFGTETIDEARKLCGSIPEATSTDALNELLLSAPPACAFGIWSALEELRTPEQSLPPVPSAALLPLRDDSVSLIRDERSRGCDTFKIKLGTMEARLEKPILEAVLQTLHPGERLRLDPNQSWDLATLEDWMQVVRNHPQHVEFIEEPLRPGLLSPKELVRLASDLPIPLALDESLATAGPLLWINLGWPGFWVVKPSLMGVPHWLAPLSGMAGRVVMSSAFETLIGMDALVRLTSGFPGTSHGLGTDGNFNDGFGPSREGNRIRPATLKEKETLWKSF
jgi:O-succinylbenzoate synthase